ncbi:DUF2288 domain-containing protein [Marinagarivorans algicola]|uniref:DUF2288 domain-containing protein n=1 Tax=Marinagarivorans algicola TaxID=1513270 RepID=UPI0006B54F78|nr:DUF2288 domain-containing protein [Marinagarivorans algicola]
MNTENAKQELLRQTAKISWAELQRYFAAGKVIYVEASLDLIDVGVALIQDDKAAFNTWTNNQLIYPVNDEQAQVWSANAATLWASVVSPWVLVQPLKTQEQEHLKAQDQKIH